MNAARSSHRHWRVLSAVLVACLAGHGCVIVAEKSDYTDYRAVRLASNPDARLLAMQHYVAEHPDGHWQPGVQAARAQQDLSTFESHKASRDGLAYYLAAFPDGVFAAQARARLSAFAVIDQRQREAAEHDKQLQAERVARQEELRRTWITRFCGYWMRTLLGLGGWGQGIAEVAHGNPTFSRAFGAQPRPRCTDSECVKYYESRYAIPMPGSTRVERGLTLLLRLRLRDGKLQRAELLMPSRGFSRWFELEQHTVVVDGDVEGRNRAVAWATERLLPIVHELAADAKVLSGYELASIPPPTIASNGELTDTSAEDPANPPSHLEASSGSPSAAPAPDVEQLIKPKVDEPAADMVFAPVQIGQDGKAHAETPNAATPPPSAAGTEASGETMVIDPIAIPKIGDAQSEPSQTTPPSPVNVPATPAPNPSDAVSPPSVSAFEAHGLRVVVFAAGGPDALPAYDGVIIEQMSAALAPAKKPATKPVAKPVKPAASH